MIQRPPMLVGFPGPWTGGGLQIDLSTGQAVKRLPRPQNCAGADFRLSRQGCFQPKQHERPMIPRRCPESMNIPIPASQLHPLERARGVNVVLGPTNTGKTHYAIERMLAHK